MNEIKKINGIVEFFKKKDMEIGLPIIRFFDEMPNSVIESLKLGRSDFPNNFSKKKINKEQYYTHFTASSFEIIKTDFDAKTQKPSAQKIELALTSNFYKPHILTYTYISDNEQLSVNFDIESMNLENVYLQTTISEFVFAPNKEIEKTLKKDGYILKSPHFVDESKFYNFEFRGEAYFKEYKIKNYTMGHNEFSKMVCQNESQLLNKTNDEVVKDL